MLKFALESEANLDGCILMSEARKSPPRIDYPPEAEHLAQVRPS